MATFTYDDAEHPFPTGKWKDMTPEDAFFELQILRDQADEDPKVLAPNGFSSMEHFQAYQAFNQDKVDYTVLGQKQIDKQTEAYRKQMNESAASMAGTEIMAPIAGVSFQQYASVSAEQAQGVEYKALLKKHGIESVNWEKAAEGWAERMRTDTTYTLVNEYGKLFMAAGQGQFGDTAKDAAAGLTGGKTTSDNPVSLEQYAEIMAAQSAAATQGKDVMQVLAGYGLNAADWGTIGMHWSSKMMSDMNVGIKFGELLTKYTEKFESQAPKAADGIDF